MGWGRLSWLIWVSPSSSHKSLKEEASFLVVVKDLDVMMKEGSEREKIVAWKLEERCHEPRNAGILQKLENMRKQILPQRFQKVSQSVQAAITEPQTKWLINDRNVFLTVMEAGSPRSECQHDWVRVFPGHRLHVISSHGRRVQRALWGLFYKNTCPIHEDFALMTKAPPKSCTS